MRTWRRQTLRNVGIVKLDKRKIDNLSPNLVVKTFVTNYVIYLRTIGRNI